MSNASTSIFVQSQLFRWLVEIIMINSSLEMRTKRTTRSISVDRNQALTLRVKKKFEWNSTKSGVLRERRVIRADCKHSDMSKLYNIASKLAYWRVLVILLILNVTIILKGRNEEKDTTSNLCHINQKYPYWVSHRPILYKLLIIHQWTPYQILQNIIHRNSTQNQSVFIGHH